MRRSSAERQRLRLAKRRNREARLRRWKDNIKTVPPCLQMFRRQMALVQRTAVALAKSLQPAIKQIQDCVGLIGGMEWGGYRHE